MEIRVVGIFFYCESFVLIFLLLKSSSEGPGPMGSAGTPRGITGVKKHFFGLKKRAKKQVCKSDFHIYVLIDF